ncbi:MAG: sugar-binding transcriptional regulator [Anaerolineae bacterium]|nr:sugar-binding transcriptional regulator [Anaerolineae bacterium]
MVTQPKDALLLRCAYLFYQEDKDILEIARMLGISRFRVSRYLKEAKERGIVRIELRDPSIEWEKLAIQLERALDLPRVIVFPAPYEGELDQLRLSVGEGAAALFDEIQPDMTIGISWGRTIAQMVSAVPDKKIAAKRVVELAGGFAEVMPGVSGSAVAARFAEKLNAECVHLPAPIIVKTSTTAESLLAEESIRRTLDLAASADMSIIGIAPMHPDSLMHRSASISETDFKALGKTGAVGSILGRFFDADGVECDTALSERAISLPFEQFRKIRERIVLAPGTHKIPSIRALARGKLLTTLVTDSRTASELLETLSETLTSNTTAVTKSKSRTLATKG